MEATNGSNTGKVAIFFFSMLGTNNLESFQKIAAGDKAGGPIAQFDIPSRFRWLTAIRSSVIQTSRPHPGLSEDLEKTGLRLFADLVL